MQDDMPTLTGGVDWATDTNEQCVVDTAGGGRYAAPPMTPPDPSARHRLHPLRRDQGRDPPVPAGPPPRGPALRGPL
jgi:hypothetical protein